METGDREEEREGMKMAGETEGEEGEREEESRREEERKEGGDRGREGKGGRKKREEGKEREKERGRSRAGQELGAGNLENGLGEPDREGVLSKPLLFRRRVKNIPLSYFPSLWLVLGVHEVQITCIDNFCPR